MYSVGGFVTFNNVTQYAYQQGYNPLPSPSAFSWSQYCNGCGFIQIGGYPGYTMADLPAQNGIVNGINDLLVYPYNVTKGQ